MQHDHCHTPEPINHPASCQLDTRGSALRRPGVGTQSRNAQLSLLAATAALPVLFSLPLLSVPGVTLLLLTAKDALATALTCRAGLQPPSAASLTLRILWPGNFPAAALPVVRAGLQLPAAAAAAAAGADVHMLLAAAGSDTLRRIVRSLLRPGVGAVPGAPDQAGPALPPASLLLMLPCLLPLAGGLGSSLADGLRAAGTLPAAAVAG